MQTQEAPSRTIAESASRFSWRSELLMFVELFALSGIVFAQPVLDSLRKNSTDIFVHGNASSVDILLLTAIIVFGPALVLWCFCVAVGMLAPRVRPYLHAATAGALVAVLVYVVVTRRFDIALGIRWTFGVVAGIAAAALVVRSSNTRLYLRLLAVAPIVFGLLFITNERIAPLALFSPVRAASVKIERPTRIVMVVMDELPLQSLLDGTGHIDAAAFPNFAALAGDSTWYRNTTSVAPFTALALPAILTGTYPTRADALPIAQRYPRTLFTLLGDTYRINAHEIFSEQLCPGSLCASEKGSASIGSLVSTTRKLWHGIISPSDEPPVFFNKELRDSGPPAARRFISSLRKSEKPTLDYLHVLLPHQPWNQLPNGQQYPDNDGFIPGRDASFAWTDQTFADQARQRHLLQLQATDIFVGDLVAKLRSIDAYDNSLIVLTADHGAGFTKGAALRAPVNDLNYPEVMWVPLLVHSPGQHAGRVDDRTVRNVDIVPTIADTIGVALPWKIDGRSVLGAPRSETRLRFANLRTEEAFNPPRDTRYEEFDGPSGFSRVLATKPFASGGDPKLRYFAFGGWSALIGRKIDALGPGPPTEVKMSLSNGNDFLKVEQSSPLAPWTHLQAGLDHAGRRIVAVAVNGKIAGITETTANFVGGDIVSAMLAPEFFVDGANEIKLFDLDGSPAQPRLREIQGVG